MSTEQIEVGELDVKKLAEQLDAAQAILDEIRVTSGCRAFQPPRNPARGRIEQAVDTAERIVRDRRARSNFISPSEIFGEPAWDVLLDLFVRETKGEPTTMTLIGAGAGEKPATIARWLYVLELNGLIALQGDVGDKRRQAIRLTPAGYESMLRYLENIAT